MYTLLWCIIYHPYLRGGHAIIHQEYFFNYFGGGSVGVPKLFHDVFDCWNKYIVCSDLVRINYVGWVELTWNKFRPKLFQPYWRTQAKSLDHLYFPSSSTTTCDRNSTPNKIISYNFSHHIILIPFDWVWLFWFLIGFRVWMKLFEGWLSTQPPNK